MLAALFFYRQRSLLAYYIGQLRLSQTVAHYDGVTAKALLEDADSWATWVWYQTGFVLMTLGFAAYGMTFFASILPTFPPHTIDVLCVAVAGYALVNAFVMRRYRYQDHPWMNWSRALRR